MQEVLAQDHQGARATAPATAEGLFKSPGQVIWRRSDWPNPVASFDFMQTAAMRANVQGKWLSWMRVDIPELVLERTTALLLLQGKSLSQLLIPNHSVELGETRVQLAHLLLRVDPWEPWRPVSRLTGLVLAQLGEVPAGISPTELLAALVSDSAPA